MFQSSALSVTGVTKSDYPDSSRIISPLGAMPLIRTTALAEGRKLMTAANRRFHSLPPLRLKRDRLSERLQADEQALGWFSDSSYRLKP